MSGEKILACDGDNINNQHIKKLFKEDPKMQMSRISFRSKVQVWGSSIACLSKKYF